MFKKSLALLLSLPAVAYMNAQDVSTVRNTAEIYSGSPINGTAKYTALAGSMGALGGDISSISTNPASTGVFITSSVAGTLSVNNNKNQSSISGAAINSKDNAAGLGQIGGVLSFQLGENNKWKFLNIGLNHSTQNIDNYVETAGNGRILSQNLVDKDGNTFKAQFTNTGHAYNRTGNLSKMNLSVGANYENKIYIGGGINLSDATIEQYDTKAFSMTHNGTTYNFSDFNKVYTPFAENSRGISLSAGIIAKLTEQFRLGGAVESPTWWTLDRTYNGQELDAKGNVVSDTYTEDRKLTTPMKMTISGAFVPNKNFSVNLDYTLGLTKPQYKVQGDAETELNNYFDQDYKNTSEVRVGAEYRAYGFRFRGGYGYASNPLADGILVGNRNTVGAGLGYDFKSFFIDAAYQHIASKYTNYYGGGTYFNSDISLVDNTSSTSEVSNKKDNFFLTLGWKF